MEGKNCGKRASRTVLSKEELEGMVRARDPDRRGVSRLTKRQLCEILGMPFIEPARRPEPIDIKVCSDRRSRRFRDRYTKDELIDMIKARGSRASRAALRGLPFRVLCGMARLPYVATARTTAGGGGHGAAVVDHHPTGVAHADGGEDCIARASRALLQHQQSLIRMIMEKRGVIAVHATGSGKTLAAATATQCYLDRFPDRRVVVITPASLVANFRKELEATRPLLHADRYTIMSFQAFVLRQKGRNPIPCDRTMLVVDEAHNFRTMYKKTKKKTVGIMTKHVSDCAERADKVLLLTATPLVNRPSDLAPLLNMIRDDGAPAITRTAFDNHSNEIPFLERYVRGRIHFFTPEDDTQRVIYPHKVEHRPELFVMSPEYLRKYEDIENKLTTDDSVYLFGDIDTTVFFNGMRRAANTLDISDRSNAPKIRWITDFLGRGQPTDKTVIFSQFLDMGSKAVHRSLTPELRAVSAFITGDTPPKDRQKIVDRFNDGEIRFLFLSKAGGEGLDLKGTTSLILVEPTWNRTIEDQVVGRVVRYRSHAHLPFNKRRVDIHRLFLIKPRDETVIDEVLGGEAVHHPEGGLLSIDLMMDNLRRRKQQEIDAYTRILRTFNN